MPREKRTERSWLENSHKIMNGYWRIERVVIKASLSKAFRWHRFSWRVELIYLLHSGYSEGTIRNCNLLPDGRRTGLVDGVIIQLLSGLIWIIMKITISRPKYEIGLSGCWKLSVELVNVSVHPFVKRSEFSYVWLILLLPWRFKWFACHN